MVTWMTFDEVSSMLVEMQSIYSGLRYFSEDVLALTCHIAPMFESNDEYVTPDMQDYGVWSMDEVEVMITCTMARL
jgi:hypothetical protein